MGRNKKRNEYSKQLIQIQMKKQQIINIILEKNWKKAKTSIYINVAFNSIPK